jgi:hypothetical protein
LKDIFSNALYGKRKGPDRNPALLNPISYEKPV